MARLLEAALPSIQEARDLLLADDDPASGLGVGEHAITLRPGGVFAGAEPFIGGGA